MNAIVRAGLLLTAVCVASGCVKEPEGPGERIGRGLDEIMRGIDEMDESQRQVGREYDARERTEQERRAAELDHLERVRRYDAEWERQHAR